MFKCASCKNVQKPHSHPLRWVVETEPVNYAFRKAANKYKILGQWKATDDPGGTGWQIVREEQLCVDCWSDRANSVG